jgi:hypothetical protein
MTTFLRGIPAGLPAAPIAADARGSLTGRASRLYSF